MKCYRCKKGNIQIISIKYTKMLIACNNKECGYEQITEKKMVPGLKIKEKQEKQEKRKN